MIFFSFNLLMTVIFANIHIFLGIDQLCPGFFCLILFSNINRNFSHLLISECVM